MATGPLILSIDQGTTSSRAIAFDTLGKVRGIAQQEFAQHYPRDGWVEHDPEEIWQSVLSVTHEVLNTLPGDVVSIGITNQRETTLVWDRHTGQPIYNAIVWQDRRTAKLCAELKAAGHEPMVTELTGLLLDPYFSGTKLAWILDNVEGARARANAGDLAFGTVDTYLIWRLTGGAVHATDATNASRTLLFDIHNQRWDERLLELLEVPSAVLPEVKDSAADYGSTKAGVLPSVIAIGGVAGDQQAATIGQTCFAPGMIKSTYGTGCFAMLNTATEAVRSDHRLLTTVAYRLAGRTTYALEGSIFVAGAAVQWLRDGLGVIDNAPQTESLARELEDNEGVYMVPAFTGLGAPHWDPQARGAVFGLTRDSGPAHFARAALESVCYQTRDLLQAMAKDAPTAIETLRVDGGMATNDWLMQFLADIVEVRVERPQTVETTALGAAYLAGMQSGLFESFDDVSSQWRINATFEPDMPSERRQRYLAQWDDAVAKVKSG